MNNLEKLFPIIAATKSEEIKPCGCRTIQRPSNMSFADWRLFIEEEAIATELKNAKTKYELGGESRFIRKITRAIIESNILD
jgi:hypothetical protein